jgi:hypothetical protein
MNRFLKTVLIIVAIITFLLAGTYLYLRFMPEKSVAKQEAGFKVNASVLASEYELNAEASDRKYIGQVIEVSGTIAEISTDQNNSIVFILRKGEAATGVLCTLEPGMAKKATKYKAGSNVTIKGTCTGMLFDVVLNKCVIVH